MRHIIIFLIFGMLLYAQEEAKTGTHKPQITAHTKKPSKDDERFRLMYQVFTYASDKENAYKVAKKALEKYPASLYWHEKMAEISQWLDKRSEALKHYQYIYNTTHNSKLAQKIIDYSLAAYQYEAAVPIIRKKVTLDPSAKNIDMMIYIYDKVGIPEDAAALLETLYKKTSNRLYIKKAFELYLSMGEMESAEKIVKIFKNAKHLDMQTAKLLSHYFLIKNDLQSSYDILRSADFSFEDENASKYYQEMSDRGWSLQDFASSAEASKKLHMMDQARLVDYERIFYYYDKRDPEFVEEAALRAYQKYKKNYILISYINMLNTKKEYERLEQILSKIGNGPNVKTLKQSTFFWLVKGQMYGQLHKYPQAIEAFKQALKLEPKSVSILSAMLWALIDSKDYRDLKPYIFDLEEKGDIPEQLWLPLAVSHFQMNQSDRALKYIKQMMRAKNVSIDVKFMYAYLMQARGDENAFMQTMHEIFSILEKSKKANPDLMNKKEFLKNYLNAAMYTLPVDQFDALLYESRKRLKKKDFTELALYWAIRNDAHERTTYLANRLTHVEPWLKLNRALHYDDRTKQLDILYSYMAQLPVRDRVTAAVSTGNIALAQTLAFEGMEENRHDWLLYQQNLDLIEQNVDILDLQSGYQSRTGLDRYYLMINNRYYLSRGWRLLTDAQLYQNRSSGDAIQANVPKSDSVFHIGLQKNFMNGFVNLKAGIRSSMKSYFDLSMDADYQVSKELSIKAGLFKSAKAEESLYLLYGGKKDGINGQINWQYLPSSGLSMFLEYSKFYSQDDVSLGDGYSGRLEWQKQIRNGYPDMSWGISYTFGRYDEKAGSKGVIDKIRPNGFSVLPVDFDNVCTNFSYGMVNKERYTRVWRPFGMLSPCYNTAGEQMNVFFLGGMGGSLYGQDHVSFGISYDQATGGTQDKSLEFFMRYRLYY